MALVSDAISGTFSCLEPAMLALARAGADAYPWISKVSRKVQVCHLGAPKVAERFGGGSPAVLEVARLQIAGALASVAGQLTEWECSEILDAARSHVGRLLATEWEAATRKDSATANNGFDESVLIAWQISFCVGGAVAASELLVDIWQHDALMYALPGGVSFGSDLCSGLVAYLWV